MQDNEVEIEYREELEFLFEQLNHSFESDNLEYAKEIAKDIRLLIRLNQEKKSNEILVTMQDYCDARYKLKTNIN